METEYVRKGVETETSNKRIAYIAMGKPMRKEARKESRNQKQSRGESITNYQRTVHERMKEERRKTKEKAIL